MDARSRAVYEGLLQQDPQLAGLFKLGLELYPRLDEPAMAHLLAHAGRELSNGVIAWLAADTGAPTPPVPEELDVTKERHRIAIGLALGLSPLHKLVATWFRMQGILVAGAHYQHGHPPPPPDDLREAWDRLVGYLFSRVGPYFETQAELDALLAVAIPGAADAAQLGQFLLRPQQRRHFFGNLQHAAWLPFLLEAGVFDFPPDRIIEEDGSWRMQAWPEGECLVRLAPAAPQLVVDVLRGIPPDLTNPAVWDLVARAGLAIPLPHARRLVGPLRKALQVAPRARFYHHVAQLAVRLAEGREPSAFDLLGALSSLKPIPERSEKAEGPEESETEMVRWWSGRESASMLEHLDLYELDQLLKAVVPHLLQLEAWRTWDLLMKRLRHALRLGDAVAPEVASRHWCDNLDQSDEDNDVRAQLAVAAMGVARVIVKASPLDAPRLMGQLAPGGPDLLARMRIAVLTAAGPSQLPEIEAMLRDPEVLEPSFGAREIAALLRAHFTACSREAQISFVTNLTRGPEREAMERALRSWGEEPTEEAIAEFRAHWQRRRLDWFRGTIPPVLLPLAEKLGVAKETPSVREQELAEVGHYSEGTTWGDDTSPRLPEELAAMSAADLIAYLQAWRPTGESFRGPSEAGLAGAVQAMIAADPVRHAEFLARTILELLSAPYLQAALAGLQAAVQQGRDIPWDQALALMEAVLRSEPDTATSGGDVRRGERTWAVQTALDLVTELAKRDRIGPEVEDRVWPLTSTFPSIVARPLSEGRDIQSVDDLLMAALNTPAGRAAEALVHLARSTYRLHETAATTRGEEPLEAAARGGQETARRLLPVLDAMLGVPGPGAVQVQTQVGEHLPFFCHVAEEWLASRIDELLVPGTVASLTSPTWPAFVVANHFTTRLFRALRGVYARQAEVLADLVAAERDQAKGDREWRVSRHFIDHVVSAVVRGEAKLGDADRLVELTFLATRGEDRAHVYWSIFRGWSDAAEENGSPVPPEFVDRVVKLWEWRLSELERGPVDTDLEEEADGLGWLMLAPPIPDTEVLRLAPRTLCVGPGNRSTRRQIWPRLERTAATDIRTTLALAETLIEAELASDYPFLEFDRVAPVLRAGLRSADAEVKAKAARLVHHLGESGWSEYGPLLDE